MSPRIDRRRYADDLATRQLDISRPSPQLTQTFRDLDIRAEDLRGIGDGDTVIRGRAEIEELFSRLDELDRTRPLRAGSSDLSRAQRMYEALMARREDGDAPAAPAAAAVAAPAAAPVVAPAGAPGAAPAAVPVAAPVVAADAPAAVTPATPEPQGRLVPAGEHRTGTGRGATSEPVFVRVDPAVEQRVAALRQLPAAEATRPARGREAVSVYLDAIAARERGDRRAPEGVPAYLWNVTPALASQGIREADVQQYLATGTLPDLLREDGTVAMSGEARMAQLERRATQEGSWTAVNSFTFLVNMRRAALSSQASRLEGERIGLPEGSPERARADEMITEARDIEDRLRRGLGSIYTAATYARERTAGGLVRQAGTVEGQARTARESGDLTRATELDARAQTLRDRGARMAHSEATYRAGMRGTGWDASSVFSLAATAQIETGNVQIDAMGRSGQLAETPPAVLGHDDGTNTGNGVPGAGRLLDDARATAPDGGRSHRVLGLEGARQRSLASFHMTHLEAGNYFATGPSAPPRTQGLLDHRQAYVEARASQADAAGGRLELYGEASRLSGADATEAATVAQERRQVLDELTGSLGQALGSQRTADDAAAQASAAHEGARQAREGVTQADESVVNARDGVTRAEDQADAVFGDTFKTSGEARRDREGISDAQVVLQSEQARARFTTGRRDAMERFAAEADVRSTAAAAVATRDRGDAEIVRGVLGSHRGLRAGSGTRQGAYTGARAEADRTAVLGAGYVARAEADLPAREPERGQARLQLAGARLDLAGYWTRSTELNAHALGDAGRTGATARLDTAAQHIDVADGVRRDLPAGSEPRALLGSAIIDSRSELAEANADYRPGVSRDQLASAERVLRVDIDGAHPTLATEARGRIGRAAVTSLARHDQRFSEVLTRGGYVADADDDLYRQAHRMLDGNGAGQSEPVQGARRLLGQVDRSLAAARDIFSVSGAQLQNGEDYAEAQTRAMARSEIQAAQAQVSSVISGGAWLITFGQFDMKEDMADAGESAMRMRMSHSRRWTESRINGANQMGQAYDRARAEGRSFEFLNSVRILSDRGNADTVPEAYGAAFRFIDQRVPMAPAGGARRSDWQDFNAMAIRGGGVPVAGALRGPVLGLEGARDSMGDRRLGVITGDMTSMMESQAESLQETTRNMGWIVAANVSLEVALGIVLTGGIGSAAAVAEGGNALNAGRTAYSAMQAARTASLMTRAGQALTALRAAHPVIHTIAVGTTAGVGMMGASYGARRLFGASSGMSRAVDIAANFVPIGAGHRAAGLVQRSERAAARVLAAEGAVARGGALSAERLLAAAHFYGPQVALGGGQAFVTTLATPVIAEHLGVRSEAGQMAIGLALNTVMSGGLAYGMARGRAPRPSEGAAQHILQGGERVPASVERAVRTDLDGFMQRSGVPTEADTRAVRTRLYERLGVPEHGGGEAATTRRAQIDSTVEALRIQRAGELGVSGARGSEPGVMTEAQARLATDRTAQSLFEARGGEAGGASYAQAYRDAATVMGAHLGGEPNASALLAAATDRAAAVEIASGFAARREGHSPVIRDAAQRQRVETVLSSELGGLRRSVETGEGRGPADRTGGPSAYERLSQRLQTEAGLSRDGAESVLRATQQDVVQRGVEVRLAQAQMESGAPLQTAQMETMAREVAERAGMDPTAARAVARDAVSRAGFVDWVRAWLPERAWSPEMHREHFLERTNPAARQEMQALNTQQFQALYADGPIPEALSKVAQVPGFGAFAAAHPAEARTLAEGVSLFNETYVRSLIQRHGFANAAARLRTELPTVRPHGSNPHYVVAERSTASPRGMVPEINLRPTQALDHNGAFQQRAEVPGRISGERRVATPHADLEVMRPSQLIVNGQPLTSMDGVMVFSGHGGRFGFSGLNTREAAAMVAAEIHASGRPIQHVVLDACHQRDRRWFFGDSNAQAFQRELNAALSQRGVTQQVTVLAAERGGPTYGSYQRSWMAHPHRDQNGIHFGNRWEQARYTPASDGARFYMSPMEAMLAAEAAAIAGGGYFVYRSLQDRTEQREGPARDATPQTPAQRPDSRRPTP